MIKDQAIMLVLINGSRLRMQKQSTLIGGVVNDEEYGETQLYNLEFSII
jgi:hypothetical protein